MVRNGTQNKGNTFYPVSLYVKNSCVFELLKKWLSKKVVSYMFIKKNQEMRVFLHAWYYINL